MSALAYEQNKRRLAEITRLLDAIIKKNSYLNETGERIMNFTNEEKKQQYLDFLEEITMLQEQIGNKQMLLD